MATNIISSKIYKLLDELNVLNEDIEMRPQVVKKIIDLIWNNTLPDKVEPITHIDYWIDDSVGSLKEVVYCVQEKINEIIDTLNKLIKHKWRDAFADNGYFCDKCGMEVDNIPSLPEFEEIEPIQPDDIPMSDDVDFLVGKINQIVNTLNKLIKQK